MRSFIKSSITFAKATDGHTAIEYAFVLALIMVAALGAISLFGKGVNSSLSTGASRLPTG